MNPQERQAPNGLVWNQEYSSLAQWKIERGTDIRTNVWSWFFGLLIVPPFTVVALLGLPIFIWEGHKGKVLQREGEAEGAVGRGFRQKGSESIPAMQWDLECGSDVRRHKAPMRPPAYLLPASA